MKNITDMIEVNHFSIAKIGQFNIAANKDMFIAKLDTPEFHIS